MKKLAVLGMVVLVGVLATNAHAYRIDMRWAGMPSTSATLLDVPASSTVTMEVWVVPVVNNTMPAQGDNGNGGWPAVGGSNGQYFAYIGASSSTFTAENLTSFDHDPGPSMVYLGGAQGIQGVFESPDFPGIMGSFVSALDSPTQTMGSGTSPSAVAGAPWLFETIKIHAEYDGLLPNLGNNLSNIRWANSGIGGGANVSSEGPVYAEHADNGSTHFALVLGTTIPEPTSVTLLALGGLALIRRRR
jgi:hypothetical protein